MSNISDWLIENKDSLKTFIELTNKNVQAIISL